MRIIYLILACFVLCGCGVYADEDGNCRYDGSYYVSVMTEGDEIEAKDKNGFVKGMWVSQFDMQPIFRDGDKQRERLDYISKIEALTDNLALDGFNRIFLQVRPNGDSMFESDYYPNSKYIAGSYGGEIEYDAIRLFLEIAEKKGLSVHAWINPYRLCTENELLQYGKGLIYQWYTQGIGKRIEKGDGDILYLDPCYTEATELIVNGVIEILEKYDFDGIHLDDYFYPTEFEFNDDVEFLNSGFDNKGDFRRSNTDRTVKALYKAVHKFENKEFGISPAGNIYSLAEGWYIDIYKWCGEAGYVDYIIPQLYFGFENKTCPFDEIFNQWVMAVTDSNTELYIGLSAAKCVLGSEGAADEYAGATGKYEWCENKDILARSYLTVASNANANGICIFTYSSFYDPLTGRENPLCSEEKSKLLEQMNGG